MATAVRLFVGGLPGDVTVESLAQRFSPFGRVAACEVVPPKDAVQLTGSPDVVLCRGFAYVDLEPKDEASVSRCLSLYNHSKWRGHTLRVERARPTYVLKLQQEWAEEAEQQQSGALPATKRQKLRGVPWGDGSEGTEWDGVPRPLDTSKPLALVIQRRRNKIKVLDVPLDRPKPGARLVFSPSDATAAAPRSALRRGGMADVWCEYHGDLEPIPQHIYRLNQLWDMKPLPACAAAAAAREAQAGGGVAQHHQVPPPAELTVPTATADQPTARKAAGPARQEQHAYLKVLKSVSHAHQKEEAAVAAAAAAARGAARVKLQQQQQQQQQRAAATGPRGRQLAPMAVTPEPNTALGTAGAVVTFNDDWGDDDDDDHGMGPGTNLGEAPGELDLGRFGSDEEGEGSDGGEQANERMTATAEEGVVASPPCNAQDPAPPGPVAVPRTADAHVSESDGSEAFADASDDDPPALSAPSPLRQRPAPPRPHTAPKAPRAAAKDALGRNARSVAKPSRSEALLVPSGQPMQLPVRAGPALLAAFSSDSEESYHDVLSDEAAAADGESGQGAKAMGNPLMAPLLPAKSNRPSPAPARPIKAAPTDTPQQRTSSTPAAAARAGKKGKQHTGLSAPVEVAAGAPARAHARPGAWAEARPEQATPTVTSRPVEEGTTTVPRTVAVISTQVALGPVAQAFKFGFSMDGPASVTPASVAPTGGSCLVASPVCHTTGAAADLPPPSTAPPAAVPRHAQRQPPPEAAAPAGVKLPAALQFAGSFVRTPDARVQWEQHRSSLAADLKRKARPASRTAKGPARKGK